MKLQLSGKRPQVFLLASACLLGLSLSAGCVSRRHALINTGGGATLVDAARELVAVRVLDRETRVERYVFDRREVARLRDALARCQSSHSLATVAPPWAVVLLLRLSDVREFVIHPIDAVLRVNRTNPFSPELVDSAGHHNPPGIDDLWLEYDDWDWLQRLLELRLGPPTSGETTISPVNQT